MRIAVIGASADRSKFGNKAVRALLRAGHEVFPVNPHETSIEGLRCYRAISDIPGKLDAATLYVQPGIGESLSLSIIAKGVRLVYLNPRAQSAALIAAFEKAGIEVKCECTILAMGFSPTEF